MIEFVVCVEDRYGISFNKRLIGRDKLIDEFLIESLDGSEVFVDDNYLKYSKDNRFKLISEFDFNEDSNKSITIYCTSENSLAYLDRSEEIIIYYWNRAYPADLYLDYDFIRTNYKLVEKIEEIEGSSHILAKEIWRKIDG